jgi:hypothetical protein
MIESRRGEARRDGWRCESSYELIFMTALANDPRCDGLTCFKVSTSYRREEACLGFFFDFYLDFYGFLWVGN